MTSFGKIGKYLIYIQNLLYIRKLPIQRLPQFQ